jgi:uncharacterized protein YeaO (DUF488 family)
MGVRIKRAYDVPAEEDGLRILVDRIWPRGISMDRARIHLWMKEVAPSNDLRKWFGHDPSRWNEFRNRYFLELDASSNCSVTNLVRLIESEKTVTLLYGTKDRERNNAAALEAYLKSRISSP